MNKKNIERAATAQQPIKFHFQGITQSASKNTSGQPITWSKPKNKFVSKTKKLNSPHKLAPWTFKPKYFSWLKIKLKFKLNKHHPKKNWDLQNQLYK